MDLPRVSLPGIITRLQSMRDGGWRVQVDTQELRPEQITSLGLELNKSGWFFFSADMIREIPTDSLPEVAAPKGRHSQAQRLRSVLFRLYEQGNHTETFEEYYDAQMERIIEHIKTKLNS